jgi:alpha-amylase
MAVMMQAFYWDAPIKEQKEGEWWNYLPRRRRSWGGGYNALWLPPICKGARGRSPGYDPYDYFDLGDFDQKGATKTLYGNRKGVGEADHDAAQHNISPMRTMVINHNSGAMKKSQPDRWQKRWTKFNPKAENFRATGTGFHPSRYERVMIEGENFRWLPHFVTAIRACMRRCLQWLRGW